MEISEEQIHAKKQELGLESPGGGHGPEGSGDSLASLMESESDLSEQAERVESQQFRQPPGTTQRNQYRYGGDRP